ncbi:MAG: cytochrome c [Candidatus Sulfotelmatobacter sp.]
MRKNHAFKTAKLSRPSLLIMVVVLLALPGFKGTDLTARANSAQPDAAMQDQAATSQSSPCKGILAHPDALKKTLPEVPKYQKTYVLVLGGSAKDKITDPTSPAIRDLSVEINDDPESAAVASDLHIANVHRVQASDQSPVQPLVDLGAGKTDAAILWAPLAGAAMSDLGLEDKISLYSVDRPQPAPAPYTGAWTGNTDPCAASISDDLDSFGVLPGELLVPVHIRDLFDTPTPTFSMKGAERGQQAFQQICARCHGQYAVWDRSLAPVNLLISIRRFQFVGFKYIVMNGRPQKGMPPLRGTVSEDQIALIYQYLVARSKHELAAGGSTPVASK